MIHIINVRDGQTNAIVLVFTITADTRGKAITQVKRQLGGSKKLMALDFYVEK